MLYLDSSALVKHYAREAGTDAVSARCRSGERICTSALTYAEILAALGRKLRDNEFTAGEFEAAKARFLSDWVTSVEKLALDTQTLGAIAHLVTRYKVRASDAVHLSAALWLQDKALAAGSTPPGESLEFGVADQKLAAIAAECGLRVFNPELS